MSRLLKMSFAIMIAIAACSAEASERGTADEARALVQRAVSHMKAAGKEKSLADFTRPDGGFVDRDLYVFTYGPDGKVTSNGGNAAMIGRDITKVKDADGRLFANEIIEIANTKGSGWVDYKWPNTVSKKIEQKSSYFEKHDDQIIGVGFYK